MKGRVQLQKSLIAETKGLFTLTARRFSVSTGCSGSEGHPLFIKLASSCTHQPPLSRTLGETRGSVGTILIKEDARDGESGVGGEAIM